MYKCLLFTITVTVVLFAAASGHTYAPNWNSLNSRPLPSWYDDAKFGIFIHWGVYSVPSFSNWTHYVYSPGAEWYWWKLTYPSDDWNATRDFHDRIYGKNFQYQQFAPMFTAAMWDPQQWVDVIVASGAKYTVLTSKHHEGFCMWPSDQSWNWNSVDVGPHRDVIGEFSKAIKQTDIVFGLYYSLYEWFHPLYLADKNSGKPPKTQMYIEQVMMPQLMDVVDKYEPWVVWSDGDWDQTSEYWNSTGFLAWLYNDSPVKDKVVTNDRWGYDCRGKNGGFWTPYDGFDPGHLLKHKWEDPNTIGTSWGYNRNEHLDAFNNATSLIQLLVGVVSTGGNLLLDIGPTSDGRISVIEEERLRQVGQWLSINGEAIYGTRPWRVQNDTANEDVWFTSKGTTVYAIAFNWPIDNTLRLYSPIPLNSATVTMLGYGKPLKWNFQSTSDDQPACMEIYLPNLALFPTLWQYNTWVFKMQNVK